MQNFDRYFGFSVILEVSFLEPNLLNIRHGLTENWSDTQITNFTVECCQLIIERTCVSMPILLLWQQSTLVIESCMSFCSKFSQPP